MRSLLGKWKQAGLERMGLDSLLSSAHHQDPLIDRLDWLIEFFQWLRSPGSIKTEQKEAGQVQLSRIRYLLNMLEKNPEWEKNLSLCLRSVLLETESLNLFCVTGLPSENNFLSELTDRFMGHILPKPPHERDLAEVFSKLFAQEEDVEWLKRLEPQVLEKIWGLFNNPIEDSDSALKVSDKINEDIREAVLYLCGQIRAFGLDPKLRIRMTPSKVQDSPFFEITYSAHRLLKDVESNDLFSRREALSEFREVISKCRFELKEAHDHIDEFGVSVGIVYQLDRVEALLRRVEVLVRILSGENSDPKKVVGFLCNLIKEVKDRESITAFFNDNLELLSQKISERSAESGANYIARNKKEYTKLFKKAAGGGFITAFTSLAKVLLMQIKELPYFIEGILASFAYSVSFIWMYAIGFTLATKQPAMTANALAEKMENLEEEDSRRGLVDEIVQLIRSQVVATFGNVSIVVPTAISIQIIVYYFSAENVMPASLGLDMLNDHSALGPSIIFASFTGVLLWASSISSGWIDNWSVYREIPQALMSNRRLKKLFGPSRLKKIVDYYQRNLASWAANISLGLLLGLGPKILKFFGIPLDVRHVTISSGKLAFATSSLGLDFYKSPEFWWAIPGIALIGLGNIAISFLLALIVAMKARRIDSSIRDAVYRGVLRRFVKKPLSFMRAPK